MIVTYTHEQMLALWRHLLAVEPLRLDCRVERTDSVDVDAMLAPVMRCWYLHLLSTAPPALLPVANVAAEAECVSRLRGVTLVTPPPRARRVVAVSFEGWSAPVEPVSRAGDVTCCADNTYWPEPMAAMLPDGRVAVAATDGRPLAQLLAVTDPGPDSYTLDESLINTIKDYAGTMQV